MSVNPIQEKTKRHSVLSVFLIERKYNRIVLLLYIIIKIFYYAFKRKKIIERTERFERQTG